MAMPIATSRNFKILIWLLPVLLVFSARGLLWDRIEDIRSHGETIIDLSSTLKKTGIHIRELPEMKADYESLVRKKIEIASSLFQAQSQADLYNLFFVKAEEAGVTVTTITPFVLVPADGYAEQQINLEIAGPYHLIGSFINKLETISRLMRVEEIRLAKNRNNVLLANIKLLVLLYADTVTVNNTKKNISQKRESYLADLQNALKVTISPLKYVYDHQGTKDPFGLIVQPKTAQTLASSNAKTPAVALALKLKGIIWKNQPLAILESLDGITYILKEGESIKDYKIGTITRSEVVIVTPQGKHVLHQYKP